MVVSAVTPGFIVVVVSVPVPVVVCGVSQEAIASDITARNKMLFISSVFVEKSMFQLYLQIIMPDLESIITPAFGSCSLTPLQ